MWRDDEISHDPMNIEIIEPSNDLIIYRKHPLPPPHNSLSYDHSRVSNLHATNAMFAFQLRAQL